MRFKIFLFLFLVLLPVCYSVGIGGNNLRQKEIFVPDSGFHFSYLGIADKGKLKSYQVVTDGPFSDFITYSTETQFTDLAPGSTFPIVGLINLPSSFEPGWKYQNICVLESCAGGQICARAKTCAVIEFLVLYKGIMPRIKMSVKDINPGETIKVHADISNEGNTLIEECSGTALVENLDSSLTAKGHFSSESVDSGKKKTITALIDSKGLLSGDYTVTGNVDCDGVITTQLMNMTIGELSVLITNYSKELSVDSVEVFNIMVESGWNDPLDIYADIEISQGEKTVSSKTPTERLLPWKTQELSGYVDTKGLTTGVADLKIKAYYKGEVTEINDKINIVGEASLEPVETVEKEGETEIASNSSILTVLLIIAVIILTSVNVYLAVRKKRKE